MTKAPGRAEPAVRRAGVEDLDRAALTFAEAMVDDPMVRWPFPPDAGLRHCLGMMRPLTEMYQALGALWVAADGLAAAAWLPPAASERFTELERLTRDRILPLTDDGGARYSQFWDWLGGHLPASPCWFLDLLAVSPTVQGRGLGTALLRHGLRLAAAEGLPAFLETGVADNVAYYASFGFEVTREEPAPGGGPTVWFMVCGPTGSRARG